ncbi:MAG TPA: sulfatase-like hydrolase/transferase, partial [Planctomycetota bacterium]|nr:sulfatase-like hydrolase/transferase [Planctomycetota bacterium]
MNRPNILVTFADDQRGMALGCAGIEPVRTPHLDQLAARGIRFSRAYHYGSCTGAVCAPSRAMFHTGLRYRDLDRALLSPTYPPPGHTVALPPTLGRKLRDAGYHTFATGKWHNGVDSFHASFDSGANLFFGGMADHLFTPVHDFDPSGKYPAERARTGNGFSTELFGQSAIDFIHSRKNQSNDQPFFCYCAFTAPHDPRTPPDEFRRLYDPRQIPLPQNFQPEHHFDNGQLGGRDEELLGRPRDPREIQRSTAEYYGMISHMDAWIGRIHAALAETGQLENTIVVHTGDHG